MAMPSSSWLVAASCLASAVRGAGQWHSGGLQSRAAARPLVTTQWRQREPQVVRPWDRSVVSTPVNYSRVERDHTGAECCQLYGLNIE
jgi:hypothetical protein